MSISVQFEDNTVGNSKDCCKCVFEEEKANLFPRSLMGTTIQDSGTRERKADKYNNIQQQLQLQL